VKHNLIIFSQQKSLQKCDTKSAKTPDMTEYQVAKYNHTGHVIQFTFYNKIINL